MEDFIAQCKRTESIVKSEDVLIFPEESRLLHAAMGMVTEAGEFMDALKKSYFYGRTLDLTNLREELGDILWYVAIAMDVLDTDFPTEMDRVIRKLRTRFPDKFNSVDANIRDLEAERGELERVIYLASPYSSPDPAILEERYRGALAMLAHLTNKGHIVYSPIVHYHHCAKEHSLPTDFAFWKRTNLWMLDRADSLYVLQLSGWKQSLGVNWEIIHARLTGKPEIYLEPISG